MLRKIRVYGKLRQILGQSSFEADLNNVGQAFSFLINNFPQLDGYLQNSYYKVYSNEKIITEETLTMIGGNEIRIIPVASGSKFLAGLGAIGLGKWAATSSVKWIAGALATGLTTLGTSMVIDGATQLIAPSPSLNPSGMDQTDPASLASNYSFNGITNISQSGVPINLIYGETIVGSVTVSNGIDTVQVRGDA